DFAVSHASVASRPASSSFQPCGTNAPHRSPSIGGTYHPRFQCPGGVDRSGMTVLATEVRQLLGTEVDVDTPAGILHGTLLSCSTRSLWLVSGENDFMVPLDKVDAVHPPLR